MLGARTKLTLLIIAPALLVLAMKLIAIATAGGCGDSGRPMVSPGCGGIGFCMR